MKAGLWRILLLAALSGFLALSWEILWARLFSVMSGSRAYAFGAMLGSYLLGLAGGSLWSMRWQKDENRSWASLSHLVLIANSVAMLVVPLASWIVVYLPWPSVLPLVVIASMLQGTVLPLLCHVSIPADDRAGARLSYVYLANIIGSGAGSLLTGFVLLEWLPLRWLSGLLFVLGAIVSLPLASLSRQKRQLMPWVGAGVALALAFFLSQEMWERLQYQRDYRPGVRFVRVDESRHGVITVDHEKKVYGNGVYDGNIKTKLTYGDLRVRPYFLSAVHPAPKEVLMIGMSSGVWAQIIANNPSVERLDVVEISEGYMDIIRSYPEVASILHNPKITITIDDGRRWLKRNRERRFDAIVMNTTFHWREFTANLLSREFLELAKARLKADGLMMWNTTSSPRAIKTGLDVFPHTLMCMNNCIGSMEPIKINKERWRQVLSSYAIDNDPVFDMESEKGRGELEKIVSIADNPMVTSAADPENPDDWWYLVHREQMEKDWGDALPITDDNLGHEYERK